MRKLLHLLLAVLFMGHVAYSADFYWVGGSGDWTDPQHWASSSGGQGGTGVPGQNDVAYFDENSVSSNSTIHLPSTVSVKSWVVGADLTKKIDFVSSQPVQINVKQSLLLKSNTLLLAQGDLVFSANSGTHLINAGDQQLPLNIEFNGSATWMLTNNLGTFKYKSIELNKGTLITAGYKIYTGSFVSLGSSNRDLTIDGSEIIVCQAWKLSLSGITYSDVGATIYLEDVTGLSLVKGVSASSNFQQKINTCANGITVDITVTSDYNGSDISCNGACDAELTVTASSPCGGPFGYDFQSSGTFTTQTVYPGLCAGNYSVIVRDSCQEIFPGVYEQCSDNINVNEPPVLSASTLAVIDPTCSYNCDGSAFVSASGGTGTLSIDWDNGETGTTPVNLCTGYNPYTVTDDNGCTKRDSVFISDPPPIIAGLTIDNLNCNGVCDGAASSNPSGENGGPYTWLWSTGSTNDTITNLCAGTYNVHIEDVDGCFLDTTFTVTEPPALSVGLLNQVNLTCFNQCIGELAVTSSNGTSPYSYVWFDANTNNPIGDTDSLAENLCAGDYYVIVTDANGCPQQSPTYTITEPTQIVPVVSNLQDVLCFGDCNGEASGSASGGNGGYTFTWLDANTLTVVGTGANINTLCAGDYILEVSDATGCTEQSAQFTINEPSDITNTMTTVDILCNGQCTGSATVTPSGGTIAGNYTVEWHSVSTGLISSGTNTTINNLCAGDYFAVIIDDNLCDDTSATFTINEPGSLLLAPSVTDITCNGSCDGSIDANASGGTGTLTYQWFDCATMTAIGGETNPSVTNLCPGDYYVVVTDQNGCTIDNSTSCSTLSDPLALNINITSTTDATCGGACDGGAVTSTSGGTGSLTVTYYDNLTDTPVGTGTSINTLCTGNYYAVVTDANGCEDTSAVFTINDNITVTGTLTSNDATCFGNCDGNASVIPSGGTAPYSYDWVEVSTGNSFLTGPNDNVNGLCAGDYSVQITDVNGCSSPPLPFTINEFPQIIADVTTTAVSCNGDCDGTAISNASGGAGGFVYTWTPAPGAGQGTTSASQMCGGNYNFNITDAAGCSFDTTIVIDEPAPFDFSLATVDETCTGVCDGTADVTLNSGGTAPITYTWTPAPGSGQGTPNASGMCAGNYTLVISDASGCDTTISFTINAAPSLNLTTTVVADNVCNGDCAGVIQATATGGTGTLTYVWTPNPPAGQGTNTITGLCAGIYSVEVTDANGCTENSSEAITEPAAFDITSSFNDPTCNGACDGDAQVTVNSGGTPGYNYSWDDPFNQTTPGATALCEGTWSVTISDINGCDSVVSFTLTDPPLLTISVTSSGSTCFGTCTGSATATVSGGTPLVSIEWFDAITLVSVGTGTSLNNLCPGDYYAVATDGVGCTDQSATFTISEDPEITATVTSTNSTCLVCDGSATVTAIGGSGTIVNYTWTPAPGAGQGTATATNMCSGVYTVDIEDSNGCTLTEIVTISDANGETITPDSTDATCFGGCDGSAMGTVVCSDPACTFQWYDGSGNPIVGEITSTLLNVCAGVYVLEVTNNSGCISTEDINVGEGAEILPNGSFTNPACNSDATGTATVNPTGGAGGFTYNWSPNPPGGQGSNSATGLTAGSWDVTITDVNGCDTTMTFTLTDPPVLDVSNVTSSDISCFGANDGVATVFPTGGVGTYSYEWFDCVTGTTIGQTTQQATTLPAGSYYAVVTDQSGCQQQSACVDVNEPAQLTGTLSGTDANCNGVCDGTAQVTPIGGINNYSYQWFESGTPVNGGTGDIITNLCPGVYSVEITDLNGCTELISDVTITEPSAYSVSSSIVDAGCFGDCDGSADLVVGGGTPSYTYNWSPAPGAGQGTASASQMCAGNYTVLISDQQGCDTTVAITIASPTEIEANASITQITCNGDNDGAISTTVSGGAGGYLYNWTPNGETTSGISGLGGGTYTVSIQDADGCVVDTTINLIEPTTITATTNSNSSTCSQCDGSASVSPSGGYGGYAYSWSPAGGSGQTATGLCAGIYTVDVTDQGGCTVPITVTISDIGAETVTTSSTDATCFDVPDGTATATFTCNDPTCVVEWFDAVTGNSTGQITNTATGLMGGDYYVQVVNNSGCITIETITVNAPSEILANETITQLVCATDSNGVIEVNPSGGAGGYTYVWSPAPGGGQGTNIATGLYAGNWSVIITDSDGCDSTYTFTINAPASISATSSSTDITCNGANDGTADVVATGGAFPYTYQWQDASQIDIPGETNSSISNLTAGDYYVVVTDQNGCSVTEGPITINEPSVITATISGTDVLCSGQCDGEGTVAASGGTGSLTVNWYDAATTTFTGFSGATVNTLCPGDYFAIITDNNGCSFTTGNITISEPAALTASITSNDANCNGVCDGDAQVFPVGGTPAYIYNWLDGSGNAVPGGGTDVVSGLCPDNYTVEVFDQNGCSTGQLPFSVSAPSAISATVFVNDASCTANDGSATVVPSGGTSPYTYQWMDNTMSPIIGETNSTISNIGAGTFFVTVTDAAGCSDVFQANVGNLNGPQITVDSVTNVPCFENNNGAAYISVTGISPPFTYAWNPSGQVGQDLLGVGAGSYTVQVTDAAGCVGFETIDILEGDEINATFTVADATCGLCDGEVVAAATGGTGTLVYDWTTGTSGTTISNLCPGTYAVDISDDNGCIENFTVAVTNVGGPNGESITANSPSCAGLADGDATVTIFGGTPPYTYYWLHDGGTTNTATGLAAGTYYLQATDSNNCSRTVEVVIQDPAPITETSLITPATCGLCDGEISLTAGGGTGPYTYAWSHGPTGQALAGLCEGVYFVDVQDANGCIETFTYPINGSTAPTLVLTPTNSSCQGNCDGQIASDTTGGTQPITYNWLDDQGAPIGQTGSTATGLCAGDYILEITDGNGCMSFAQATIDAPSSFQFSQPTSFDVSCAGGNDGEAYAIVIGGTLPYTYTWTPAPGAGQGTSSATGLTAGTYTVEVMDANGCVDQQDITVDEPLPLVIALDTLNDALCWNSNDGFIEVTASGGTPGYTYSWVSDPAGYSSTDEDIDSLFSQDYIITLTDANNCTLTDTFTVDTLITVIADAGPDTSYCAGNNFEIIGTGTGTNNLTYTWYDDQGNVIDNDSALLVTETNGTFTYVFEAADGQCYHTDTVVVTVNPLPVVNAGADVEIIKGEVVVIGGSPTAPSGSSIAWDPPYFMDDSTLYNPSVDPDTTTQYIVYVVDANGCANSDTILVTVYPDIVFPNGFSPNGDGVNETWEIDFIDQFPESVVEVYNRWGDLLFRSVGYIEEWDGTYNNQPLPVGTYYYVIDLNHPLYPDVFTGPITILR